MVINLERIFNFFFYFYSFYFLNYIHNRKNFFIGKLGVFTFFIKKYFNSRLLISFLNYYKKIFLNFNLIKLKFKNIFNYCKIFNNYNFFYIYNIMKLNKLNYAITKLKAILLNLGFKFINSREIDCISNNFYFLNISKNHPSLSFNDTFYLNCDFFEKILLRTHSTNFHFKTKYFSIPLKNFTIGKVYRPDNDRLHLPIFTQLDILFIDNYLKFIFLKKFFLNLISIYFFKKKFFYRFRSSYFPFTYLSREVDFFLKKNKIWLEVCGMGMVYFKVLENLNININLYKGFAIGLGIERLLMIYYDADNLFFL